MCVCVSVNTFESKQANLSMCGDLIPAEKLEDEKKKNKKKRKKKETYRISCLRKQEGNKGGEILTLRFRGQRPAAGNRPGAAALVHVSAEVEVHGQRLQHHDRVGERRSLKSYGGNSWPSSLDLQGSQRSHLFGYDSFRRLLFFFFFFHLPLSTLEVSSRQVAFDWLPLPAVNYCPSISGDG